MFKNLTTSLAMVLICGFSFAQKSDNKSQTKALADAAWARAGCGVDDIHFAVKVDKSKHPLAEPESGKAMVYVFEDDLTQGGLPPTRVGLDGKWVGGNVSGSYLFFSVTPAVHRLCSNDQNHPKQGAALDFTAEAGKAYFFRIKIGSPSEQAFKLDEVPEAEGHFLIASHGVSTSSEKERYEQD
jgi:hypothetical protein